MSDLIGSIVGNYRVLGKLASGGMGVVYRAEHRTMGQIAVVKQLLPQFVESADTVERFFQEARAAASIDDPGIVKIFDQGTLADGSAYIIMEMLRGESLAKRLERERLSPAQAVTLIRQAARAIGAAHARGIIHRDLKPDNLFLVPDPEVDGGERIKVLDFGIAKLRGDGTAHAKTATAVAMGTPGYMSPEQWASAGHVDERTDVYAIGCVLHEMLTGNPPFRGPSLPELMDQHRSATPPSPGTGTPLDAIVLRCLAKKREDRFASMNELVKALPARESLPSTTAASSGVAVTLPPDAMSTPPTAAALPSVPKHARSNLEDLALEPVVTLTRRRRLMLAAVAGLAVLGVAGYLAVERGASQATDPVVNRVMAKPLDTVHLAFGPCASSIDVTEQGRVESLGKDVIKRSIRQYKGEILACDQRRGSNRQAKLAVTFTIGADGSTSAIHIDGASDPNLEQCITVAFGLMRFPKPPGGGSVVIQGYPIVLPFIPESAAPPNANEDAYLIKVPEVLVRDAPALSTCYEQAVAQRHGLAGIMNVDVEIDAEGVLNAKASGLAHDGFESCAAQRIKTLHFPSPPGPRLAMRCPIAFASTSIPTSADGAIVTLARGRVTLNGAVIELPSDDSMHSIPALTDAMHEVRRRLGTRFFTVEANDDVDGRLLIRVLFSSAASGFDDAQFARLRDGQWEAMPAVIRIAGTLQPDRIAVQVTPVQISVKHGTVSRQIDIRRGKIDTDSLGRALDDFKRTGSATQLQLQIAADEDVEYDVIATVVDIAITHQFISLSLGPKADF